MRLPRVGFQFSLRTLVLGLVLAGLGLGLWQGVMMPTRHHRLVTTLRQTLEMSDPSDLDTQSGATPAIKTRLPPGALHLNINLLSPFPSGYVIETRPRRWSLAHLFWHERDLVDVEGLDLSAGTNRFHEFVWSGLFDGVETSWGLQPIRRSPPKETRPIPTRVRTGLFEAAPALGLTLKRLNVCDTDADDALAPLWGRLRALEDLDLRGTPITDETVAALADLPNLKTLHLTDTPLTERSVDHLLKMPSLETLSLPDGATAGLPALAAHPTLTHLIVPHQAALGPEWIASRLRRVTNDEGAGGVHGQWPRIPVWPDDPAARAVLFDPAVWSDTPTARASRWRALAGADGLTRLDVLPGLLTDIPEEAFAGLAELEEVMLRFPESLATLQDPFDETLPEQLAALARLPNLKRIALPRAYYENPEVYAPLQALSQLENLSIVYKFHYDSSSPLPSVASAELKRMLGPSVRCEVHLSSRFIEQSTVVRGVRLPSTLQSLPASAQRKVNALHVKGPVPPDAWESLANMTSLWRLHWEAPEFPADAVRGLAACPDQTDVHLEGGVTPETVSALPTDRIRTLAITLPPRSAPDLNDDSDATAVVLLQQSQPERLMIRLPGLTPERCAAWLTAAGHKPPWSVDRTQPALGPRVKLTVEGRSREVHFVNAFYGTTIDPSDTRLDTHGIPMLAPARSR